MTDKRRTIYPHWTGAQFDALNLRSSTSAAAARMVLVDGATPYRAALVYGISHPTIYRYLAWLLSQEPCPCCGQLMPARAGAWQRTSASDPPLTDPPEDQPVADAA